MWKCPNCETINNSEFCIICGEPKPEYNNEPDIKKLDIETEKSIKEDYPVKKKQNPTIIAVICISLISIVLMVFLILEGMRATALNAINSSDNLKAIDIASKIEFYRDCDEILLEAAYNRAQYLIDSAEYSAAAEIISERLSDEYKDVKTLKQYVIAMEDYEADRLLEALNDFDKIVVDFKDVSELVTKLKSEIYDKGIELYRSSDYVEAKEYFDALKSEKYKDTEKYLILIDAHEYSHPDVSILYELISFEDTKEILMDDEYIEESLMGNWTDRYGNYLKIYKENKNDDITWCSQNLADSEGAHWKIKNKIQYYGSDASGWKKYWIYNIISKNTISVHNYIDGKTYTLKR